MVSPPLVFPPLPKILTATVFGRSIRYYDVGSGPPLLLIHGLGGDADEWAFCFEPFSQSHRVIALDLLGFGRSDKPLIDYTIGGFVEVIEEFLRGLKIERAAVLGESLGGWIASAFALKFREPSISWFSWMQQACGVILQACRSTFACPRGRICGMYFGFCSMTSDWRLIC